MRSYSISQRKKSRGNNTWYGRTFEDGVLVSEVSLKTKRKSDATDWLNMMNAARFMPDEMRRRFEPSDRAFGDAIQKFISSVEAKGDGGKTVLAYRSRLAVFDTWVVAEKLSTFRALRRRRLRSSRRTYPTGTPRRRTGRSCAACRSSVCGRRGFTALKVSIRSRT